MNPPHGNLRLGDAEIALAMELRTEGVQWKLISYGLGVSDVALKKALKRAEQEGMRCRNTTT